MTAQPDFLEAVTPKVWCCVVLGGHEYPLPRLKLYNFYRLIHALVRDDTTPFVEVLGEALGVEREIVEGASLTEIFAAWRLCGSLARPLFTLPFMHAPNQPTSDYDYVHRSLAVLVHRLALAYGWTRDYILYELYYEEALCYLQEILLDDYQQREFAYMLSTRGIDKSGKQRPFPKLPWRKEPGKLEIFRMPRKVAEKMLPAGTIIDLEELAKRRSQK